MGDLFFHTLFPFIDLSSGGGVENLIKTLEDALQHMNAKTKIIPGHGPLASKGFRGLHCVH